MALGTLEVQVVRGESQIPIENAKVTISRNGEERLLRESPQIISTNSSGQTVTIELDAPEKQYSQAPSDVRPYSTYDIRVEAEGFSPYIVRGTQILPGVKALQAINMLPSTDPGEIISSYDAADGQTAGPTGSVTLDTVPTGITGQTGFGITGQNTGITGQTGFGTPGQNAGIPGQAGFGITGQNAGITMQPGFSITAQNSREIFNNADIVLIPEQTLWGDFPSKIPETEIKPLPPASGGVVLQEPVVPEYIVVHLGSPNDASAKNVTVRFSEYIKNVCSSEIYATWSENTIRANVYCILSFVLNRIYTEWYRGKGQAFQITNSTAFDQAYAEGRNIYDNISVIVDEMFTSYVKRPGVTQPLLTQFCDGQRVSCPNWLSQWGSKELGDQGRTPEEILKHYYGSNLEFAKAKKVSGVPQSYPGYTLAIGSTGQPVRNIQEYLNRISQNYPLIPKVAVTGNYNNQTAESVKVFQQIFNLPQTGNVDFATWYKISQIYVGVTKIAELRGSESSNGIFVPPSFGKGIYIPTITYPY